MLLRRRRARRSFARLQEHSVAALAAMAVVAVMVVVVSVAMPGGVLLARLCGGDGKGACGKHDQGG
jgi:hypothetical protein